VIAYPTELFAFTPLVHFFRFRDIAGAPIWMPLRAQALHGQDRL